MLVFQPLPSKEREFGDLRFSFPEVESGIAKFDLSLRVIENKSAVCADILAYSQSIFDSSTIPSNGGQPESGARTDGGNPGQRIGELVLLSEVEREQMLVEWNRTEAEYPSGVVHSCLRSRWREHRKQRR